MSQAKSVKTKSQTQKPKTGAKPRVRKAVETKPEVDDDSSCTAPEGSFSHVLWAMREQAGVKKGEMALKLKVKAPVITKIESGRHYVSEKTAQRYATALGYTVRLVATKASK